MMGRGSRQIGVLTAGAVLVAAACGPAGRATAPRGRAAPGIRFGRTVAQKGVVCETMVNEKFYARFKVARPGGKVSESLSLTETRIEMRSTVRAAGPRFVTALEVFYRKRQKTELEPVKRTKRRLVSPVQGQTYLLQSAGGELQVTGAAGRPVTAKERRILSDDNPDVGRPMPTFALLPQRPIRQGERLVCPRRAAERAFGLGRKQGMRIARATMTLTGTRTFEGRRTGVFALRIHARTAAGRSTRMEVWIRGTLQVEIATGWPVRMSVSGPLTIQSRDDGITLKGTGLVQSSGLTVCR